MKHEKSDMVFDSSSKIFKGIVGVRSQKLYHIRLT